MILSLVEVNYSCVKCAASQLQPGKSLGSSSNNQSINHFKWYRFAILTSPKRHRISLTAPIQPRKPINIVTAPTPTRMYAPVFNKDEEVSVGTRKCTLLATKWRKRICAFIDSRKGRRTELMLCKRTVPDQENLNSVTCYFMNVSTELSSLSHPHLQDRNRVCRCSRYNDESKEKRQQSGFWI